ncbi:hypothetical protein Tco_0420981 [Tanacetum coccineum]
MAETIEQYMSKSQRLTMDQGLLGPKLRRRIYFESIKGQFLKELRTNTFSGSNHEDANEHIDKVLEIVNLFHIPNITIDQVMLRSFPMSLTGAVSRWLRNEPTGLITTWDGLKSAIPSKTAADAKVAIQEMVEYSQKWHNGISRSRRPHSTKDFLLKEKWKTLEEAYYTEFSGPFQGGGYRAASLGFYQRNNVNPSYQERRQSMEDTLSKFMSKSAKRHEENSNLIKENFLLETLVLNRSLDPFFEDYIELNDLNELFELRRNQGDDLIPTIEEGDVIEEFRTRDDELNTGINDYPKFHDSIIKDNMVYKGNNVIRALMNVPIFVGTFSVMTDFAVLEDMDAYRD